MTRKRERMSGLQPDEGKSRLARLPRMEDACDEGLRRGSVPVLVAYASRHGATQGIAERIAETLRAAGQETEVQPVAAVGDPAAYDAFVVGAAAYMGSWLKEAVAYVREHREALSGRPVWLFSSGPLGTERKDAEGHDLLAISEPKEFAELKEAIRPRGVQVFFGALDERNLPFSARLLRKFPAGEKLLPVGDFRDWAAVDTWAETVAGELAPAPAAAR